MHVGGKPRIKTNLVSSIFIQKCGVDLTEYQRGFNQGNTDLLKPGYKISKDAHSTINIL